MHRWWSAGQCHRFRVMPAFSRSKVEDVTPVLRRATFLILPVGVLGRSFRNIDVTRHHETGHPRLEETDEALRVECASRLRDHRCHHLVLGMFARHGKDRAFKDIGVKVDFVLHLEGGDVLAAPADGITHAVDKVVAAVRCLHHGVARVEPQVGPGLLRPLRVPPVARHEEPGLLAADDELADSAVRHLLVVGIDDPRLVEFVRQSAAGLPVGIVPVHAVWRGHLRRPVGGLDLHVESPGKAAGVRKHRDDECAFDGDVAVAGFPGLACQEIGHGPEKERDRCSEPSGIAPEAFDAEPFRHDGGRAGDHRRVAHGPLPGDVEERQRRVVDVAWPEVHEFEVPVGIAIGLALGNHDPLGRSRGARGIHHRLEIVVAGEVARWRVVRVEQMREIDPLEVRKRARQCGLRACGIEDDETLEMLEVTGDLADAVEGVRGDDHRAGGRIIDDVGEKIAAQCGVDGNWTAPLLPRPSHTRMNSTTFGITTRTVSPDLIPSAVVPLASLLESRWASR